LSSTANYKPLEILRLVIVDTTAENRERVQKKNLKPSSKLECVDINLHLSTDYFPEGKNKIKIDPS